MTTGEAALKNTAAPPAPWEAVAAEAIGSNRRMALRDYIQTLDPRRDCQQIAYLTTCYEFSWDTTRSLELALFRVFGVAKGTPLLVQTGEFVKRTQKRYDDTVLILAEILESGGYDTVRGQAALARMNKQHGRYSIPNDEYLYTLSTFIFEPIRWMDQYGWRAYTEKEKQAGYYFWRELGRRMGIRDIPHSLEAFEQFNRDYEAAQFRYSPDNKIIASATLNLMLSWFLPKSLYWIGSPFVRALLDEALLSAVGMQPAPRLLQALVKGALRLRARLIRLLPARRKPRLMTNMKNRTYPDGYIIAELGAHGAKDAPVA